MIDLNDAVGLLQAKRRELADQLDAVDKALAALSGFGDTVTTAVVPKKLKPPRTLSDDHKHALNEGRRKARHSRDAAAGLARDMADPSPGHPPASGADSPPPRLVKRIKP